ncbi:hypothetical protein COOONC_12099 [Cooperia oncophora]
MRQDIVKWTRECQRCFISNNTTGQVPPLKPIVTTRPFEIVGVDLLEIGLTSRGNRYILARECIIDQSEKYRAKAKQYYDRHWKSDRTVNFNVGDRLYVKVPGEKGASHIPKVIASTPNSATVTEIGVNKEPIQVPFDHLIKVPASIDDTPVISRKRRGAKRGRKGKMAATFDDVSPSRRSVRTDISTIDCRCPGVFDVGMQSTACHTAVNGRKLWRTHHYHELVFNSSFELARAVSILRQTHVFAEGRAATLVDHDYITLSASSLGFAMSFFRANCLHLAAYHRRNLATDEALGNLPTPSTTYGRSV